MGTHNYFILIFLSSIVIVSYFFNLVALRFKIPSVLLLLGLGLALRQTGELLHFEIGNLQPYLEIFGILGLILIVLEAALDIKITEASASILKKSGEVALFVLILGVISIACLFHFWLNQGWQVCIINAFPLTVISSAIVIPSISHLSLKKKEFLIYEATLSDILGILLFNLAINQVGLRWSIISHFFVSMGTTMMLSCGSVLLLVFLITRIKHHVKFFIVLSIMMFIYALGKLLHLSPLLLIFLFGIFLNNSDLIPKWKYFRAKTAAINSELVQFKLLVSESAFVIRTFFFVMFGYAMELTTILNKEVFLISISVMAILIMVRLLYLAYIAKIELWPELFMMPKGLVSILLFYGIPRNFIIPEISSGVVFLVISMTSVLMGIGIFLSDKMPLFKKVMVPRN